MSDLLDRIPDSVFRVLSFLVIAFLLFLIVFPLYFMATTAFKEEAEIYSQLTWFPAIAHHAATSWT